MPWLAALTYHLLLWNANRGSLRSKAAAKASAPGTTPAHLFTGKRGELLAYWYLRRAGYRVIARNRPSRVQAGEIELIGWDGPVLAFVEVKTRTSAAAGRPEAAVIRRKQRRVANTAREYLRRFGSRPPTYRFDIVSVLWDAEMGYDVRLTKDAFRD
jgi:putative endonuclease